MGDFAGFASNPNANLIRGRILLSISPRSIACLPKFPAITVVEFSVFNAMENHHAATILCFVVLCSRKCFHDVRNASSIETLITRLYCLCFVCSNFCPFVFILCLLRKQAQIYSGKQKEVPGIVRSIQSELMCSTRTFQLDNRNDVECGVVYQGLYM